MAWLVFASLTLVCGSALAANFVIHISVDGLQAASLQQVIDEGHAPNFKRFQAEGLWTNNARTDYDYTITLPNHTSMLTGRPVLKPEGMDSTIYHGYTENTDPFPGETLHSAGNPNVGYIASVFDVVHDAGLSTALYASKTKFVLYDRSYDATNGTANVHGRDKIDRFFVAPSMSSPYALDMQNQFLADMESQPTDYTFVHYTDTDFAGHSYGWGGDEYLDAIVTVDGYLADVFELVETNATLAGKTTIVLTTDHGGTGYDHSDASLAVNFTIPFYAWGAGVGRGDLYAINGDTRVSPGSERPSYSLTGQPIRNGDSGNLALTLLGLGPIPGSLINAAQDLRLALPGDYDHDGTVGTADCVVWRDTLDAVGNGLAADGNGNNQIDAGDFNVWRANFGRTSVDGSGASSFTEAAVPEPDTLVPLLGGLLCGVPMLYWNGRIFGSETTRFRLNVALKARPSCPQIVAAPCCVLISTARS